MNGLLLGCEGDVHPTPHRAPDGGSTFRPTSVAPPGLPTPLGPDSAVAPTGAPTSGDPEDEGPGPGFPSGIPDADAPPQDPQTSGPDFVDFHIKPGTGRSGWNTEESPVVVPVGKTLRIHNDDDSAPHMLHSFGTPCPHGDRMPPGSYYDCPILKPYETGVTGKVWDHYRNQRVNEEIFWIRTEPPPDPSEPGDRPRRDR